MTVVCSIGSDLAHSLVSGLGANCATAAALARVMSGRHGGSIDLQGLTEWPAGAVLRVANDFVARRWLTHRGDSWLVGPDHIPCELPFFLDGAAAMRAILPDDGRATAVVTMPPEPSAIGSALPATGTAYAALVSTQQMFERIADAAANSFTIMTPFLNSDGLEIALDLFRRSQAVRRCLIIRRSGAARLAVDRAWSDLHRVNAEVLDYTLPVGRGYETFHAKVLLADQDLAYVGSANMTVFARHSMELGMVTDGRAARVVASIVRGVERVATRIQARSAASGV